ncbi:MAG: methylmalonyl-CoA epimerase, partial [Flavobacteriales bacterium]|nr:methylmalonyl-CoA epimerase [Flavobacteriales bacterium]
IAEALPFYTKSLNLECTHTEEVASEKVNTAFLPLGEVNIELLEGTDPESPITKYVEKRGEGIHHICYQVDDINATLAQMKEQGIKLINEEPKRGAHNKLVAFVHPKSTGGILIELSQDAGDH